MPYQIGVIGAGLALALASAALAQDQATAYVEVKEDSIIIQELNLRVDQVEDLDVYDSAGALVGDVEDVLGSSPGAPVAIAVDADRYLGQEGDDVIIPFGDVKLQDGRLVTGLSKDELLKLPRFKD